MNAVPVEAVPSLATPGTAFTIEARTMGSSWSRRDRIIRLAKLRDDKAALAIMEADAKERADKLIVREVMANLTESELRALWGDR